MKVENVCLICSKPFFTKDQDSYICENCIKQYLQDYYKQLSYITKIEDN